MKMKLVWGLFPALLLFASCATLTESQLKNVNAFATTAKNYTSYPSVVVKKRAEFQLHNGLLGISQVTDAELLAKRADTVRAQYDRQLIQSDKFDLSLRLLQQYAGLLAKLSSNSFVEDLAAPTKQLGENLGDLVKVYNTKMPNNKLPATLGATISKVILLVGQKLTKRKQTKEIQKFVVEADSLVIITINNLVEVLDREQFVFEGQTFPSLNALIAHEKAKFVNSYRNTIFANPARTNYPAILTYNQEMADYENTDRLLRQIITAASNLQQAHHQLAGVVQQKKSLTEIIKETQQLIEATQEAAKSVAELFQTNS